MRRRALPRGAVTGGAGPVVDLAAELDGVLAARAGLVEDRPQLVDGRRLVDVDVQHVQHRIEAGAVPFRAAEMSRRRDRALQARRRVDRPGEVAAEVPERLCPRFRRDVRQVGFGQGLANERLRLERDELRRRRFLAGHGRARHRHFLHREERFPRVAIEHEREAHLGELHDGILRGRSRSDRDQDRRGRIVVVPDVVAHGLVVPLALARDRVEREDRVGEQVVALAEPAVEVLGRRAGGREHPAALLVDGHAAPGVGAAVVLALDPLPGVVADLSLARDRVERPLERAGDGVVATDVAGRGVVALVDPRRNDQDVLEHRARRRHLDHRRGRVDAEILPEIDEAVAAERRNQLAGPGVDRVGPIAHEVEDALSLGPFPIHQAAVAQPDHVPVVVSGRIERPDLAAGRRVQRHRLEARRGHVHHAVHHDRVHVHRRPLVGVAGLVFPGALEPVDVAGVNLRQRRILVALRIAAVDRPVDGGRPAGGNDRLLVPGDDGGAARERRDGNNEGYPHRFSHGSSYQLSAISQNRWPRGHYRTFLICTFHFGSLHSPQFDPRNILLAD